jgi:hypothetical protein
VNVTGKTSAKRLRNGTIVGRGGAVGHVLLRAVVPETDLVLVVEPALVVLCARGVEDPATEALAHCGEVVAEGLAVGLAR